MLQGVGCRSMIPETTNVLLMGYSAIQPRYRTPLLAQTDILNDNATTNAVFVQSRTNQAHLPTVLPTTFDGVDNSLPIAVPSADDFRPDPWRFDSVYSSLSPEKLLNSETSVSRPSTFLERLWDDQNNFFAPESVALLGGGLVIGGLMANSSTDENIHRHFQGSVRGATSDDWFESLHASKELGNGIFTLPVFASAWMAGELFPDNRLVETTGRWGERSIRGFVVGAPR